jgi:type II secretory pathway component PulF
MVQIGARSNDLPGMLTVLADHYHRSNAVWTRLKGLMVYPVIVILVSLGMTAVLTVVFSHFVSNTVGFLNVPRIWLAGMWMAPAVLACLALLGIAAVSLPSWRAVLRWRLPPFREASLAQLASAIALMLRNGMPLADALALAETLEQGTPAGAALAHWQAQVAAGAGKPAQWTGPAGPFPPLFLWLVQKGGEDVASGFQKAADLYQNRAAYRTELALYGALPISVLFLGQMIFWQVAPLMHAMTQMMNVLGDSGG